MAATFAMQRRAGLEVLTFPALDGLPVDAVVTTRHGGVSDPPYDSLNLGFHVGDDPASVVENRSRAAAAVGLGLDDLVFCRQTHGREVVVVGAGDRGKGARSPSDSLADADALVTAAGGVGLAVLVADCVPIVMVDPDAGVLACVHAGWRGTVAGVAAAAVEAMADQGARAQRVVAGVGPAVPVERYQVGDEVASAAADRFGPDHGDVLRPDGTGRWLFDLWAANRRLLVGAGVRPGAVHVAGCPTGAGGRFFSDRAARPCGRFAAIARLR